ncbi:hypothetical protein BH23ACT9_BH23ACT9_22530 [soil metagenome]
MADPCPKRAESLPCEPLNRVWLTGADWKVERAYAVCTCGTRFGIGAAKDRWREHQAALRPLRPSAVLDAEALGHELDAVPAADRRVPHAAPGVVPVGQPVIHTAGAWVDAADPRISDLAGHMRAVMDAAPGIGLAANQVGVRIRVIALNFADVVPPVWVNPVLIAAEGRWTYPEGCLSLVVEGTTVDVVRPARVTVAADLPGGGGVIVEADELLARVIQHELDHLEGIEYVQRLDEETRADVDALLTAEGIDPDLLPPTPYEG